MVLQRGAELNRGKRRTLLENPFGVVQTNTASLGTIGGKLAETAEKITLFQADIMDKEWQNDFDTSSSAFIVEETRKELQSTNPDLVGLQQKLLSYKDKALGEAPQRFANYITNKLDVAFSENINLVTDYANDLKYTNLLTKTQELETSNIASTTNYIDQIIKNNPGDIEKQNMLIETHYTNVVTPAINRIAKNYETLNQLKPLKITPTDIEVNVRALQTDYSSQKFYSKMKSIIGAIDFDNSTTESLSRQLIEANDVIDDMIENFVTNPEYRDINNLSDSEVESIRKNYVAQKEQLLNFNNKRIKMAEIATNTIIAEKSQFVIDTYINDPQKALNSSISDVLEIVANDDYLFQNPTTAMATIQESLNAISIHKSLKSIYDKYNGIFPEATTLKELIKNDTDIELTDKQLIQYRNTMIGVPSKTTNEYMMMVQDVKTIPGYGEPMVGKTVDQINLEKENLYQIKAFEYNMKMGNMPMDGRDTFAKVDAIISASGDGISSTDAAQLQNTFEFYRLSKSLNPLAFYEAGYGEVSDFFLYLDKTRGEPYLNVNITDIENIRRLYTEYRDNVKAGFDFDKANEFVNKSGLDAMNSSFIESRVIDDAQTQYGPVALFNWVRNKIPSYLPFGLDEDDKKQKTSSYTDLFGLSEFEKLSLAITQPVFFKSDASEAAETRLINLPPDIEAQLNSIYTTSLNKLVDFSLVDSNPDKLRKDIENNQKLAMDMTIRKLRDEGFGVSKYESSGPGLTLAYQPVDDKIIYERLEDKDMYIAVHFYNRVKDMEEKYNTEDYNYMMENYPQFYINNFGTDQENKVEFNLARAYEIAIEKDGVFLERVPGTDVYRYNLDPNYFYAQNQRLELDGDIDEAQYFSPTGTLITEKGEIISNANIISNAIKRYLDENPLDFAQDLGIDQETLESIFTKVMYPGVKFMTSEEEIMNYIDKQSVHTFNIQ